MADFGALSLWIALALSSYAAFGSVLGKVRGIPALLESSRHAIYLLVLVLLVATLSLVGSFITHDFEVALRGAPQQPGDAGHLYLGGLLRR